MTRDSWQMFVGLVVSLAASEPCLAQTDGIGLVNVSGHMISVRTGGPARVQHGPTIVLEAGLGDRLTTWDSMFHRLATLAPTVAYDRPGNGGSEPDGSTPTPEHAARNLRALLTTIGAAPPYLLVGHSWGGLLVRMFAALYPADVAAIVYIDPTDLRSLDEEIVYYREQGYVGEAMKERKGSLLRFPGADRGEFKVLVDAVNGDFADFRHLPVLPPVPMAIFMAAAFDPVSWKNSPCQPAACEDVVNRWRIKWLRDMMVGSKSGTLTIATTLHHYMHMEDPELIIDGIRHVLTAAQP